MTEQKSDQNEKFLNSPCHQMTRRMTTSKVSNIVKIKLKTGRTQVPAASLVYMSMTVSADPYAGLKAAPFHNIVNILSNRTLEAALNNQYFLKKFQNFEWWTGVQRHRHIITSILDEF